jgi:hypothetical protein
MTSTDEHDAKSELLRLDDFLDEKILLIGGLAVQRYVPGRASKDLDIVCSVETQKTLLQKAYPTREYEIDEQQNDLRPQITIHHISSGIKISLGPKIKERAPYQFINYSILLEDAKPFEYDGKKAKNIYIPQPYALAFSKLISFAQRRSNPKSIQDLRDFSDLTNIPQFSLNRLIGIVDKMKARSFLSDFFQKNLLTDLELAVMKDASPVSFQSIVPLRIIPTQNTTEEGSNFGRALIDSVLSYANSRNAQSLSPLIEQVHKLQFVQGVVRRSWDVSIEYDISKIDSGVIYERINWEYELMNVQRFPVVYDYEFIHSIEGDAGNVDALYALNPDGTREEITFDAAEQKSIGHFKSDRGQIQLDPESRYLSTLFYTNTWYVNSSRPMITNSTTSKIPCLYTRIVFSLPEGFRVSLLATGVRKPNVVGNKWEYVLPVPLLAEQKIEWMFERIPTEGKN